tara:strand:+ start:574 stop:930 length:357 start_codon:yes stop_codon:yes gene_type:complete
MTKPIYASLEHQMIIESYLGTCLQFAEDVSTKSKYLNYVDLLSIIYEYHNEYGKGIRENSFYDWLLIIPINVSVATNGFFAGLETPKNRAVIRAYKTVLDAMVQDTVDRIDNLNKEVE